MRNNAATTPHMPTLASRIWNACKSFFDAQPENWLARCGLVLAAISAFTSGYGIFQFATAVGVSGWVAFPISIGLGLIIQMIVVSAIRMMSSNIRELGALIIALLIVLASAWSLSVSSSYGSWWVALSKEAYEERATQRVIREAVEPLNTVSIRFTNATNAFQNVALHTQEMAREEDEFGTSCGYQADTGRGVRWRLRQEQNAEAQLLAGDLAYQNRALTEQIGRMNSADRSQLSDAYRLAAATVAGSAVNSSRAFITSESDGFANGFTEGETQFTCSDPLLQRYLSEAMTALSELPEISPTPPVPVVISDSEGMLLSVVRMWRAGFGGTQEQDVTDADMLPLAIPFIIEIIMTALLILGYRTGSGAAPSVMPVPGGFRRAESTEPNPILKGITLNLDEESEGHILSEAFANHVIESRSFDDAVLVVPCDAGPEREISRRLRLIAENMSGGFASGQSVDRIDGVFDWSSLPKSVSDGWTWHAPHCELYRLPRATVAKMRRMFAQHAAATIFSEAKGAT